LRGLPGKDGSQGLLGEKGDRGDFGPRGLQGAPGALGSTVRKPTHKNCSPLFNLFYFRETQELRERKATMVSSKFILLFSTAKLKSKSALRKF